VNDCVEGDLSKKVQSPLWSISFLTQFVDNVSKDHLEVLIDWVHLKWDNRLKSKTIDEVPIHYCLLIDFVELEWIFIGIRTILSLIIELDLIVSFPFDNSTVVNQIKFFTENPFRVSIIDWYSEKKFGSIFTDNIDLTTVMLLYYLLTNPCYFVCVACFSIPRRTSLLLRCVSLYVISWYLVLDIFPNILSFTSMDLFGCNLSWYLLPGFLSVDIISSDILRASLYTWIIIRYIYVEHISTHTHFAATSYLLFFKRYRPRDLSIKLSASDTIYTGYNTRPNTTRSTLNLALRKISVMVSLWFIFFQGWTIVWPKSLHLLMGFLFQID
jgi:hypothetical protein